jgi:hypothetical protein
MPRRKSLKEIIVLLAVIDEKKIQNALALECLIGHLLRRKNDKHLFSRNF